MDREQLLSKDKQVRRDGDAVIRPAGPETPHVHALLRHLAGKGLYVPRALASDGDVLSYIEGEQVHPYKWTDEGLTEVARMIARLHAAARDFAPAPDAVWKPWCLRELGAPSLISHGDIAPWNAITRAGLPIALIDWEYAGPIDPMVELARACWLFPQLFDDEIGAMYGLPTPNDRARQVRLMLDAYGLSDAERGGFADRIIEVVLCETAHEAIDADVKPEDEGPLWGFAWRTRSAYWVWRHRDVLMRALR